MPLDPDRVRTVTFDSYSTLVDVEAAEAALADRVPDPEPVSRLWRSRSLAYTFVANAIDAYQPFYEMNRDALTYALAAHGVDLPSAERDEILAVYHELEVFDDVRSGIKRLREGGYEPYVLSNGNPEMLDSMIEHAGIGDLIAGTISADEVETFKPTAELYRHAPPGRGRRSTRSFTSPRAGSMCWARRTRGCRQFASTGRGRRGSRSRAIRISQSNRSTSWPTRWESESVASGDARAR